VDVYLAHIEETYRRLGLSTGATANDAVHDQPQALAVEAGIAGPVAGS
jgi:hypothetical protein